MAICDPAGPRGMRFWTALAFVFVDIIIQIRHETDQYRLCFHTTRFLGEICCDGRFGESEIHGLTKFEGKSPIYLLVSVVY